MKYVFSNRTTVESTRLMEGEIEKTPIWPFPAEWTVPGDSLTAIERNGARNSVLSGCVRSICQR